ncbi:fasciclin domain-containing protein [Halomonas koreensis]|uniref:Fasciclin domain-containing protein n=1 Tax=Halomonas koreensis TaxID=245385 RepID=A0ABU1G3L0_9GAMM|nr:fasciclin domain-containing protein [Halomonas koreensis]MDR5867536.1 fasciclin domain-containing protein [Halomonas koreensis]
MKASIPQVSQWFGVGLFGLMAAGNVQADHHGMQADIVDTAVKAGQFETLVAAVQAAELVDTLKGEGPFTVFAPTDQAFAALPEGTVEELLEPANRDTLRGLLTYHVVPGKLMAEDAMAADAATTVQGQELTITTMDGQVMIDDATVIQADIEASNGVIHVIDGVLMPE